MCIIGRSEAGISSDDLGAMVILREEGGREERGRRGKEKGKGGCEEGER